MKRQARLKWNGQRQGNPFFSYKIYTKSCVVYMVVLLMDNKAVVFYAYLYVLMR